MKIFEKPPNGLIAEVPVKYINQEIYLKYEDHFNNTFFQSLRKFHLDRMIC